MSGSISTHPLVDHGIQAGVAEFAGGTLLCNGKQNTLKVRIAGEVANNHA